MLNPLDLTNKRYLITGAASGIGRATSQYLSQLGASLLLIDINQGELEKTQELCVSETSSLLMDVTKTNELKQGIGLDIEKNGKLNGFAHCAGRSYISPLKTINEETANKIYSLNSYAIIELSKIFTHRNHYAGEKGSIVLISSVYGLVGSAANIGYAMSKGAIHGITKSMAIELAPKHIRVNCIAPGFLQTEMSDQTTPLFEDDYTKRIEKLHPLGWGKAEDIAAGVAYLFSDMSKWVTGSILSIDGGFTAQ